ncbi:MAG TPA: hypothetical protein P5127_07060, partial [Oscillospiraceae bacterium]|nr:hypothetical protein [Oscillospiraceae bacterium]
RFGSEVYDLFDGIKAGVWYKLKIELDCTANVYSVLLDGRLPSRNQRRPVHKTHDVERLIVRTKAGRYLPNFEIYPDTPDLPGTDYPVAQRDYFIKSLTTRPL